MEQKNVTTPTIFIVLGATGDLMSKKIVPALFNLHEKGKLPANFKMIGVSRREWTDGDFKNHVKTIFDSKIPDAKPQSASSFLDLTAYHKITFENSDDYIGLSKKLEAIDNEWGMRTNKIFYLSVPPQSYEVILENIRKSRLAEGNSDGQGWTRIVVEKPFGSDEKSAKALDVQLAKLFKESQIYRIDHYLAKEMLQNIMAFRFGNNLFERQWDNTFIEKISIRLFESIGVEDRGSFYDTVGTLRDVGQNHHLQMLALVTMDKPASYDADGIRAARAKLLETLKIPNEKVAAMHSFRAQYDGYTMIKGVAADSKTETYFRVKGFLSHPRWVGVPIIMEGGKRLGSPLKEIEILLRHQEPCLCDKGGHDRNRIVIHLEPGEGISIIFYVKKAGYDLELEERRLSFHSHKENARRQQYTQEYEKLILDCIGGDQTLFVSSKEISAMWKFIDPFVKAWGENTVPLMRYAPDSAAISQEAAAMDYEVPAVNAAPLKKEIGIVGLGKMGAGLAYNMSQHGWRVVGYDQSQQKVMESVKEGIEGVKSLDELLGALPTPRVIWLMVPAGKPVDDTLFGKDGLALKLQKGDLVIDGGNSFFEDSARRAKLLAKKGIGFLDAGVSGGPSGARNGACVMVGGDTVAFKKMETLFLDISVPGGYAYFGAAGAGHFVKMVHNGIEYGMMQSIAEGFALMKKSPFKLDLEKIATLYNHGSVVESRLVGWLGSGFNQFGQDLKSISGSVSSTGEGEWTVKTGKKWGVKMPVISDSLKFRTQSKKSPSYTGKILSALRNQFGGHSTK